MVCSIPWEQKSKNTHLGEDGAQLGELLRDLRVLGLVFSTELGT